MHNISNRTLDRLYTLLLSPNCLLNFIFYLSATCASCRNIILVIWKSIVILTYNIIFDNESLSIFVFKISNSLIANITFVQFYVI